MTKDIKYLIVNYITCSKVQGLGTNPINQMAIKYGLKTVTDNSENVAFYDNHGPINATKEYNAFGDALSAINDLAGTLVKNHLCVRV